MPRAKKSVEEKRREAVRRSLEALAGLHERKKSAYETLLRRAPVLLLTNGLGQFLAYLTARGRGDPANPEELLRAQLSSWVLSRTGRRSDGDLLDLLTQRWSSRELRRATLESLQYLTELKSALEKEGDDKR